jgi:hypothetical protein
MHERRVEVAFENKRWTDLVSTGLAKQVLNAQGVKIKADQQAYYYPSPTSVMAGFLVSFYNVVDTRFCFLFRSQKFWSTLRLSKTLVIKKYYFTILKSDPIFMQLLPSVQRSGLLWKRYGLQNIRSVMPADI